MPSHRLSRRGCSRSLTRPSAARQSHDGHNPRRSDAVAKRGPSRAGTTTRSSRRLRRRWGREVLHLETRATYVANEVGRLAGVSGHKIGQWARNGYIQGVASDPGRFPLLYSFQDIAEAIIVHELLDRDASYAQIRRTTGNLR